jgi:chemotaxis protein histidine kinase CheA
VGVASLFICDIQIPSTSLASARFATMPVESDEGGAPQKKKREAAKAKSGDQLKSCICEHPLCRQITAYYLDLDEGEKPYRRGGWVKVPSTKNGPNAADYGKKTTDNGKEKYEERNLIYQSLFGKDAEAPPPKKEGKDQLQVSKIHFPDEFLPQNRNTEKKTAVDRDAYRDLFERRGYLKIKEGKNAGKMYAGPIYSFEEAKKRKDEYEAHARALKAPAEQSRPPPSRQTDNLQSDSSSAAPTTPTQPPAVSRPRPTEKKVRREGRGLFTDQERAMAAASELAQLREDVDELQLKLDEATEEVDRERAKQKELKLSADEESRKMKATIAQLKKNVQENNEAAATLERYKKTLNRYTLASDDWHRKNDDAALVLFGVKDTWKETVVFLQCCFPGLDTSKRGGKTISKFEALLLTLMRTRQDFDLKSLAYLSGRKKPTISGYVGEWLPRLENRGKCLYELDTDFSHDYITKADADRFGVPHGNGDGPSSYFECTETKEYQKVGLEKVAVAVDGKCFPTETPRSNSALNRAMQDSKTHGSAFLSLCWSTQSGLIVTATDLVCGRASEMKLNDEWGKTSQIGQLPTIVEEAEVGDGRNDSDNN